MSHLHAARRPWPAALSRLVAHRAAAAAALVIVVFYALAAAAAFHGYYGKWEMMDGVAGQSLPDMLEGDANRPFVYRQLLPSAANLAETLIPPDLDRQLEERLVNAEGNLTLEGGVDAHKPGYAVRYRIVYYLAFGLMFASLFMFRALCLEAGAAPAPATIAPLLFALLFPIFLTRGGYFYDLSELFFFSMAAWLAVKGRFLYLLALAVPATLNKESFLFYAITLYPFFAARYRVSTALGLTGAVVAASGLTYLAVRTIYAGNPGVTANFQLLDTALFYLNPLNLLQMEQTYGVPLFKGYSIVTLGLVALIAVAGWGRAPQSFRRHAALALAVNLPLFFLFCAEGEMRNLSMLYVSFVVLTAGAAQRWLAASGETKAPQA